MPDLTGARKRRLAYSILYEGSEALEAAVGNLAENGGTGLYWCLSAKDFRMSEQTNRAKDLCERNGLELILGLEANLNAPSGGEEERVKMALDVSPRLALGNHCGYEWKGTEGYAVPYLEMADRLKFQWVCTVVSDSLVEDMAWHGGRLRECLGGTPCFTLLGAVLMGYLFSDPRVPQQGRDADGNRITGWEGRNLYKEFGLSVPRFREYLGPMNVVSGAGFQKGLEAGTREYADALGFKGVIVGWPFDLSVKGSPYSLETPTGYPERCGRPDSGYKDSA